MSLIEEIKNKGIIQFGEFVLKSGKKSNIYANFKNVYSFPDIFDKITKIMLQQMHNSSIVCNNSLHIIGIPTGAVPIATSIARLGKYRQLLLRTEKKNYGTKKQIEGVYSPGDRVILVEDVITTGGSVGDAVKIVEEHGLIVVGILSIFDRSEEYGNTEYPLSFDYPVGYNIPSIKCKNANINGIPYEFVLNMYDVNYINNST